MCQNYPLKYTILRSETLYLQTLTCPPFLVWFGIHGYSCTFGIFGAWDGCNIIVRHSKKQDAGTGEPFDFQIRKVLSYLDIYISQNIWLCKGDFEGQFQTTLQVKDINFWSENSNLLFSFSFNFWQELSSPVILHTVDAILKRLNHLSHIFVSNCKGTSINDVPFLGR